MIEEGSGRCLCGEVTYRFKGKVLRTGHCHCESCRRTTSSPITTFFCVARADLEIVGDGLREYASSPGVLRGFCGRCGSPMTFETTRRPGEIDLYVATLNDASGLDIEQHWHWEERVDWLNYHDDLPKKEG